VNFTQGSPQWLWLLDDLRSVNRSVTPWILFGGHRPMYVDSDYGPDNEVECFVGRKKLKDVKI